MSMQNLRNFGLGNTMLVGMRQSPFRIFVRSYFHSAPYCSNNGGVASRLRVNLISYTAAATNSRVAGMTNSSRMTPISLGASIPNRI